MFFRASTRETAEKLGLSGFVRNEPDGAVYAELEGSPDQLDRFVDWVKQGPPQADVAHVQVDEGNLQGYKHFEVQR